MSQYVAAHTEIHTRGSAHMVLVSITLPLSPSLSLTLPLSFVSSFSFHRTPHQKQPRQRAFRASTVNASIQLSQSDMFVRERARTREARRQCRIPITLLRLTTYPSLFCALRLVGSASRLPQLHGMSCRDVYDGVLSSGASNMLQHAATRCNTLRHAATLCNKLQHVSPGVSTCEATQCEGYSPAPAVLSPKRALTGRPVTGSERAPVTNEVC